MLAALIASLVLWTTPALIGIIALINLGYSIGILFRFGTALRPERSVTRFNASSRPDIGAGSGRWRIERIRLNANLTDFLPGHPPARRLRAESSRPAV